MTELYQKDFTCEYSACLNITNANLRFQNKTLTKIIKFLIDNT